ncbi:hypothetical protein SNEBB_002400 [Seison nebaliae]|nr:hypothetical protein SNEBB_002400 [Seison nebaliae]
MRISLFCRGRNISKILEKYSQFHPSALSIRQFLEFGQEKESEGQSFNFLRKELLVRLANITREIDLLPRDLLETGPVQQVRTWYITSFDDILDFEKVDTDNSEERHRFNNILFKLRTRHSNVVETMAQGVMELKEKQTREVASDLDLLKDPLQSNQMMTQTPPVCNNIQYFLDRFYMSRIGIRMLMNQHLLLFGERRSAKYSRHIGSIDPECNVVSVIEDAYENAKFLCDQYYLCSPELSMTPWNTKEKNDKINLAYVPSHLYHIMFELFKNAMRAVVEFHGENESNIPKIQCRIILGGEDLSIHVSDRGGGVPRSIIHLLFQYMYSTAPQPQYSPTGSAPLAGYGYGLPLSRLYARYFHGDLLVTSMEGYGTDAWIYLKAPSNEANELLPVFNLTSNMEYQRIGRISDWSDISSPYTFGS